MKKYTHIINGMHGEHCVNVIKTVLSKQQGVTIHDVEPGKAIISLDESLNSNDSIISAIEKMGYKVVR
ncbi:heavy-metal-associated domain-containing protein [Lacibacter sp. H375]|uniref:heavy-metal-associated domain-containing protein n=1 Tax=Lacibacter sp. H375 TaxID=3133424 RepID=UPI0030C00256